MIDFPRYAQIKDRYCICYFGHCDEYLIQLRLLRKHIEKAFPGLEVYFGCRDEKLHLVESSGPHLKVSEIKSRKQDFAHIVELRFNGVNHPVEELLDDARIDNRVVCDLAEVTTSHCVILTGGIHPTKPMEKHLVERHKGLAKKEGFTVEIDGDWTRAGWVIGVESPGLFLAASQGIRTSLVPTGLGTRLYKNMFPFGEVMNT